MTENNEIFNPMIYDALLELATRIGGQYNEWADNAKTSAAERHWREAGIEMRRQVREIDSRDKQAIEAKRAELRTLWQNMPEQAPELAA